MPGNTELSFHWADYIVFALTLLLSSAVGIYYAYKDRAHQSVEEYMLAGRSMPVLPVTISMFVSWCSAISFLSDPVEVYYHGAVYTVLGLGYTLALFPVAHLFAPYYHKLNIVSCYEFLNSRFNRGIQMLGSFLNAVITLGYLAIVLYAPSLAFSQVSGLSVWLTIVVIGLVSTFYTTLGGMKAVLWADTLQVVVMISGLLAVIIRGCLAVGGVAEVWRIAEEGGRINFNNLNPSPLVRSTVWAYLIGGFFRVFNPYISTQFIVQRYSSLKTPSAARNAVYWNVPFYLLLCPLMTMIGLVMFAHFRGCDPMKQGRITKPDQMVPLMMLELLGFLPGVPGIFLACVFSASLSTLSSAQSAIVATLLKDFIEPAYSKYKGEDLSDRTQTLLGKMITVLTGIVVIVCAFSLLLSESPVFQMTIKFTGILGGPMAGTFLLGVLCPSIDTLSTMLAVAVSTCLAMWLGLGSLFVPRRNTYLPITVAGCGLMNSTIYDPNTTMLYQYQSPTTYSWADDSTLQSLGNETTLPLDSSFQFSDLYYWSPMLFAPLGTITTVVLGLLFWGIKVLVGRLFGSEVYTAKKEVAKDELELESLPVAVDRETVT